MERKEPTSTVGRKVLDWPKSHSGFFSVTSYGKIEMNSLANPVNWCNHYGEQTIDSLKN